jgi:hypothetical protein
MENSRLKFLIIRNKAKLDHLIEENAEYSKILKQSKRVDHYIAMAIKRQVEEGKESKSSL